MTKAELLKALETVPDDATVSICGGDFEVCVYDQADNLVTFDHDEQDFLGDDGELKSRYRDLAPLAQA